MISKGQLNSGLIAMAGAGNSKAVLQLLDQGADVNPPSGGDSALLCATARGHLGTVRLLITRGADVNQPNRKGVTPLMIAALNGRADLVACLISNGAQVDLDLEHGDRAPALIWAADNGHAEVAKLLLKHGANVNSKDSSGNTALSIARSNGYASLIRLLKRAGAAEVAGGHHTPGRSVFGLQGGLPSLGKKQ